MAHMLDMSNGRANIAYVGETPWHGMGQQVLDPNMPVHEWAIAAGMDWSAVRVPVGIKLGDEWHEQPGKFTIVRDDTFAPLGTFTDRYKVVQPDDILSFFRDFILTDDRFTMETAGCLKGGGVVWALAKFSEHMTVMGEAHAPYVMLSTSFDGTLATTAQATMIRVVCNNTLQASIYSKNSGTVKIRHSQVWNEKTAQAAHEQLEQVSAGYAAYKGMAEALAGQRMARQAAVDFFKGLIGADAPKEGKEEVSSRKSNQLDALMTAYDATLGEGTDKGTAWTVFNAVTRYVDHDRATRRTNGDDVDAAKMLSRFFGSGAALKSQALEMLQAA